MLQNWMKDIRKRMVLEAKLYLGNNLVCSIASEPIENSEEYINQSEEKIKQDCESKAFVRLAKKNHYLMEQTADFIKQLYEYYYLEKNEIRKPQKNISPELLASFDQQLTKTEDIKVELHNAALN